MRREVAHLSLLPRSERGWEFDEGEPKKQIRRRGHKQLHWRQCYNHKAGLDLRGALDQFEGNRAWFRLGELKGPPVKMVQQTLKSEQFISMESSASSSMKLYRDYPSGRWVSIKKTINCLALLYTNKSHKTNSLPFVYEAFLSYNGKTKLENVWKHFEFWR